MVKLRGRLCMGLPLDKFNATMTELLEHGHDKIILDLEEMPAVDSSGIGLLMRHLTTAKQSGGNIRLFKPTKFTVQTLKMVGLLNLFSTYDDLGQAFDSLR